MSMVEAMVIDGAMVRAEPAYRGQPAVRIRHMAPQVLMPKRLVLSMTCWWVHREVLRREV